MSCPSLLLGLRKAAWEAQGKNRGGGSAWWDTGQMGISSFASPLGLALRWAVTQPASIPASIPVPALRCLAVRIARTHHQHRSPGRSDPPARSQADNYLLLDSVVMSPGAHFPSKQFSQQILQRKQSPTEGPGRTAVPVMDA